MRIQLMLCAIGMMVITMLIGCGRSTHVQDDAADSTLVDEDTALYEDEDTMSYQLGDRPTVMRVDSFLDHHKHWLEGLKQEYKMLDEEKAFLAFCEKTEQMADSMSYGNNPDMTSSLGLRCSLALVQIDHQFYAKMQSEKSQQQALMEDLNGFRMFAKAMDQYLYDRGWNLNYDTPDHSLWAMCSDESFYQMSWEICQKGKSDIKRLDESRKASFISQLRDAMQDKSQYYSGSELEDYRSSYAAFQKDADEVRKTLETWSPDIELVDSIRTLLVE